MSVQYHPYFKFSKGYSYLPAIYFTWPLVWLSQIQKYTDMVDQKASFFLHFQKARKNSPDSRISRRRWLSLAGSAAAAWQASIGSGTLLKAKGTPPWSSHQVEPIDFHLRRWVFKLLMGGGQMFRRRRLDRAPGVGLIDKGPDRERGCGVGFCGAPVSGGRATLGCGMWIIVYWSGCYHLT